MFLSKKHLNILNKYNTGDLDFEGICFSLKLNTKQIYTLLNDKESIEMLFEYGIWIDLFDSMDCGLFGKKYTMDFIKAIYKHGLEENPQISEKLEDFTERLLDCDRDEMNDYLEDEFEKEWNDLPCIKSFLESYYVE